MKFVKDDFKDFKESTIGAAFLTQTVFLPEKNTTVKFEIWDTAGQERYRSLAPMYYRNASCAVVVYDISSADSYIKAKEWVDELRLKSSNEKIQIALVGNKLDLVTPDKDGHALAQRQVKTEEVNGSGKDGEKKGYVTEYNEPSDIVPMIFYETSAKSGENVHPLFTKIAESLPLDQVGPRGQRNHLDLRPETPSPSTSGCAC
ncbi:hypothetical protein AJ80_06057 [Polytolypa hystricis UAMH7299]|uniref:GTP-binding protein ypt5 n=1 Tax=Polytolypa hystricis (strain UAMH7299) TaxID=1447883 RepID=A0A2B7XZ46_POLH7|nr:hypothetical protein AJ80_06057 [Polytolypa hystricis UAMH7299]